MVGMEAQDRPVLVDSSVWYTNATLLNVNFDVAVVQMEFDEPLYTNGHSFLCPDSNEDCPSLDCKPCDWSGQAPEGCGDPDCCGPAQNGDMELAESWCAIGDLEYETLIVGETSQKFSLEQGETMYVRFYIPEDLYCRSILLVPRPFYGTASWTFSTLDPYPTFSTVNGWRNGLSDEKTFGFGQNAALFCPNTLLHPEYNAGTYSGMLYGLTQTEFEIELLVNPDSYPLDPPSDKASCSDVPADVVAFAERHNPAHCIEDSGSQTFTFEDTNEETGHVSMYLPVSSGCKTISFVSGSEIPTSPSVSHRLYCLPSVTALDMDINNAIMMRISSSGQTMILNACFDEDVTYLFCTLRIIETKPVHFSWSTVSAVVRKDITNIPDASLSYMDGLQAVYGVSFGGLKFPCFDYFTICFDATITPSNDALFLYPPPASADLDSEDVFEDLPQYYRDVGLSEKKQNSITMMVIFEAGTLHLMITDINLISIAFSSISDIDGLPVTLPGGGADLNEAFTEYSASNYLPHMPLADIPLLEFPPCDTKKYAIYEGVVLDRLEQVSSENEIDEVLASMYTLDVMNVALLAQSCTTEVADNLDSSASDVTLFGVNCPVSFDDAEWVSLPCCDVFLSLLDCCLPFDYNTTTFPYGNESDVSNCGEQDCASSYYEDLSFSLNNLDDATLGCTSGIRNPSSTLSVVIREAFQIQYVACLNEVGFGEFYQGVTCQVDADCDGVGTGVCHQGICAMGALEEVEDQFLLCYIRNMPFSLESYIRRNVMETFIHSERNSTIFYNALKEAATYDDCVAPLDPLAIQSRTRYQSEPMNKACVSDALGLGWPNSDFDSVCPGESCLRSYGCLINVSTCIYKYCDGWTQTYIEATEEDCPIENDDCNIEVDDCSGFHCVYCPPNGDFPCTDVPAYTTESECSNAVACELPDGTVDFTLTASECRQQGEGCSVDCLGDSCESVYLYVGACFVPSVADESDCSLYATTNGVETEWYSTNSSEVCVVLSVSEDDCGGLPSSDWETCQEHSLSDCDGDSVEERYLGCYVSKWRECADENECESSGMCNDRENYARVLSYDPVEVQYGSCVTSGEYVASNIPFCGNEVTIQLNGVGCLSNSIASETECTKDIVFPPSSYRWVEPALTQDECEEISPGRSGCLLYTDPLDVLLWIFDEDECACRGGVVTNRWEWTEAVWRGGVPRSLEWKEAVTQSAYVWQPSVSFILLAEWIKDSTTEQFLYPLQSEIICESNSITRPVFTLVCDCLDGGGEVCYDSGEEQKEIQMGFSEVCEDEERFVKTPSAQVTFDEDSVQRRCSFLNVAIIYQNWFSAPFVPPPLSIKWEEPRDRGVVINKNDATVGEVLGDGLVLTFSAPSNLRTFRVCLRLGLGEDPSYDVPDFGYTTSELESIYPVGLDDVDVDDRDENGVWYCADFNINDVPKEDGNVRLFPINREENYEDDEDEYVSDQTRILCYVLGAFYCFTGTLSFFGLLFFLLQAFRGNNKTVSLPNVCTFAFLIVCIFRACFMFLYPTGTFEFEPLAYFVVFEIPTFVLFSVLIFMIYSFKRLVYKKGFFPGNPTPILIIGWGFVWGLWVIVTVVYSEVILEDDGGSSACEGRVEVSYEDSEESTRNLSIAYQSAIIAVTFFLTTVFFYYTYQMYKNTKKKKSAFKRFVIFVGGSFNIAFFVRTVLLLIILAADFASSIYLFITLFLTEVLMMLFLLGQFNFRYLRALASSATSSSRATMPGTSQSTSY